MLDRRPVAIAPAVLLALVTTAGTLAQERSSIRLSIAGQDISPELQPRVVIDRLRDGDEARITLHGMTALHDMSAIADGDAVDVIATTLDGTTARMFNGFVSRISQGSRDAQATVEITALGAPDVETSRTPLTLTATAGGSLLAFAPRLSATASIQSVLVYGFDAAGAPVVARATAPTVPIGGRSTEPFGRTLTMQTDRVFETQADADAFAYATLAGFLIDRVSGEAVIEGRPDLRVGTFVNIEGLDVEFDGPYYVAGVSHRFGSGSYGGFSTTLRVRRGDLGMYRLPEIDDEVLVAFEHGDVTRPYVVDSWWTCDSRPRHGSGDDRCRLLRWPW
jgi:Type VI secretion system/phage-baseplate injector OB domain